MGTGQELDSWTVGRLDGQDGQDKIKKIGSLYKPLCSVGKGIRTATRLRPNPDSLLVSLRAFDFF